MTSFVISSETAPPSHKMIFMFIPGVAFHVGELINATESYFFRDWKILQLVVYVPILALVLLYFLLPEPARWLMSKGHVSEARHNLEKQAKLNGKVSIPNEMFNFTINFYQKRRSSLIVLSSIFENHCKDPKITGEKC